MSVKGRGELSTMQWHCGLHRRTLKKKQAGEVWMDRITRRKKVDGMKHKVRTNQLHKNIEEAILTAGLLPLVKV